MSERYHVVPLNDLKAHTEAGEYCACQPSAQYDGLGNVIMVHNSYDGREFYEEEIQPVSSC